MYQPNWERIAHKVVHDSLRLPPGETVVMNVRSDTLSYAERIADEIYKVGSNTTMILKSDEQIYREIMDTPIEYLHLPWAAQEAAMRSATYRLTIGLEYTEPSRFASLPPERMRAYSVRYNARSKSIYENPEGQWVGTDYPTRYMAQAYSIPWSRLFEMFWRAMDVDYGALQSLAGAVAERLEQGEEVRIESPRGTDLRFPIGPRPITAEDGVVRFATNLPAGEITVLPPEEQVEGRVVFDLAFHQGKRISGLEFVLEGGRATPIRADEGWEVFIEQWEAATGDKDRIAEFGIGTNPEIHSVTGYPMMDQKVYGSVQLSWGRNDMLGGSNKSSLRWPMYLLRATVYIDDRPILKAGQFVV